MEKLTLLCKSQEHNDASHRRKKRQPQQPESDDHLVNEFILAVSHLLMADKFQGTALYKFLINLVRRWHIGQLDLDEVIVEAVKRSIEYVQKYHEPIRTPEAWIRQVSLNILRRKVDSMVKGERTLATITVLAQHAKDPLAESEFIEQLEYLEVALSRLSREAQTIIRMQFLQHKTYEQLRHHYKLLANDGQVPSIPALRKRESRALQRLRKIFFKIYESNGTASG